MHPIWAWARCGFYNRQTVLLDPIRHGSAGASPAAGAAQDLVQGLTKNWMWTTLAVQDLRLRYRGSVLGPFWLTIGTGIMIGATGILYAELFHKDVAE